MDDKLIIAGPCSVESYEQLKRIAIFLKSKGINYLRGGAYKPRTSPYSFQGLREKGLEILKRVKEETNMKIVTECMDIPSISKVYEVADIIQVGSRNMYNYSLLKELGKLDKPILLKRAMSATIDEWIKAAEYIALEGNDNIILCERGIRTFENYTRNTLDLSAIPIIKKETDYKIIVDPSHGTGLRWLVTPMAKAAMCLGADGLLIEVHYDPDNALSDGFQTIDFEEFDILLAEINRR